MLIARGERGCVVRGDLKHFYEQTSFMRTSFGNRRAHQTLCVSSLSSITTSNAHSYHYYRRTPMGPPTRLGKREIRIYLEEIGIEIFSWWRSWDRIPCKGRNWGCDVGAGRVAVGRSTSVLLAPSM